MRINPAFLAAVNRLAVISDTVFAGGDAGVHFELLARASKDVARMQTADGHPLNMVMRSELGGGPLVLLTLWNFRLPGTILVGPHDAVSDAPDALPSSEENE